MARKAGHLGVGANRLCVIKARTLCKALGNNTSLIPLNRSISIFFDFEHPAATNCFVARWKLYQLKGSILNQALNLIQSSLVPFGLLLCRALHCLMVSVRLTIMRHCFECTCSGGVCILHSLVQCQVIELLSTEQVLESSLN